MNKEDYIQLQTLLAKIDVFIHKELFKNQLLPNKYIKRLQALGKGVNTIRKNLILAIDFKED